MCKDLTVIYITDNVLDEHIAVACKYHLLKALGDKRLITVSQKPLDFGDNICVGDIGRSGFSISRQIKVGLDHTDTKFIAIAEHDCIYHEEHFNWIPPDEKNFYYNISCWLLQYNNRKHLEWNGMFSYRWRRVQSQLITSREQMLDAMERKISILGDPKIRKVWPGYSRLGEPGVYHINTIRKSFRRREFKHKREEAEKYASIYTAKIFRTKIPNIDIRHDNNITGQRRGGHRRRKVSYWGTMEDLFNV